LKRRWLIGALLLAIPLLVLVIAVGPTMVEYP
jgi:hypothetical protein